MPAKFQPKKKKKIVKPYDFTEQICLDFTEQTQKKGLTSIPNKYPKAQPKRILKKKKKKNKQTNTNQPKPNMNIRPPIHQSSNGKAKAKPKIRNLTQPKEKKNHQRPRLTPQLETSSSST